MNAKTIVAYYRVRHASKRGQGSAFWRSKTPLGAMSLQTDAKCSLS